MMKRIPIAVAKRLAKELRQTRIVLITYDPQTSDTHVVTYGKSLNDSAQASDLGNAIKTHLGFPKEACQSVPARVARAKASKKRGKLPAFCDSVLQRNDGAGILQTIDFCCLKLGHEGLHSGNYENTWE